MTLRRTLEKDRRRFGPREQKPMRQPPHELRHWFIIGIDAADRVAGFILEGGKGAPLVDDERLVCRRRTAETRGRENGDRAEQLLNARKTDQAAGTEL